jgi:hypothetical protein
MSASQLHSGSVMKRCVQTFALSALLVAAPSASHAQISFGIRIGEPPAPRAYHVAPRPGPDYVWVEGYQYPDGGHYRWHDGYWTRPPYEGAYWVEPYHLDGQYLAGRWEGARGNVAHDHRWDRGNQRDERRNPGPRDREDGRR